MGIYWVRIEIMIISLDLKMKDARPEAYLCGSVLGHSPHIMFAPITPAREIVIITMRRISTGFPYCQPSPTACTIHTAYISIIIFSRFQCVRYARNVPGFRVFSEFPFQQSYYFRIISSIRLTRSWRTTARHMVENGEGENQTKWAKSSEIVQKRDLCGGGARDLSRNICWTRITADERCGKCFWRNVVEYRRRIWPRIYAREPTCKHLFYSELALPIHYNYSVASSERMYPHPPGHTNGAYIIKIRNTHAYWGMTFAAFRTRWLY